jgi:hypothetical protein
MEIESIIVVEGKEKPDILDVFFRKKFESVSSVVDAALKKLEFKGTTDYVASPEEIKGKKPADMYIIGTLYTPFLAAIEAAKEKNIKSEILLIPPAGWHYEFALKTMGLKGEPKERVYAALEKILTNASISLKPQKSL